MGRCNTNIKGKNSGVGPFQSDDTESIIVADMTGRTMAVFLFALCLSVAFIQVAAGNNFFSVLDVLAVQSHASTSERM